MSIDSFPLRPDSTIAPTDEEISVDPILQYFQFEHLPDHLQLVSAHFCTLATGLVRNISRCAERSAALRKLMEAKDCAVRASLPVRTTAAPADLLTYNGVWNGERYQFVFHNPGEGTETVGLPHGGRLELYRRMAPLRFQASLQDSAGLRMCGDFESDTQAALDSLQRALDAE